MQPQPKALCGHCGKRRLLRNVMANYAGETRQLDICRPCNQAVKEAFGRRETPCQEAGKSEYEDAA